MKKITNTALWGKITMILNAVLLVLIIVSGIQLKGYDSKNTEFQRVKPNYIAVKDSIGRYERSIHITNKKIEGGQTVATEMQSEIEALNQRIATIDKKDKKTIDSLKLVAQDRKNQIDDQFSKMKADSAELALLQDTLNLYTEAFAPIEKDYNAKMNEAVPALKSFNVVAGIAVIVFIIRVLFFAIWVASNMDNLYKLAPWLKRDGNANDAFEQPSETALKMRRLGERFRYSKAWSVISWFIPIYNLVKPCGTISTMLGETKDLLKNKGVIADKKDSAQMESVALWWGSYLFCKLMGVVVGGIAVCFNFWFLFALLGADTASLSMGALSMGTFFGTKGLFCFINHNTVLVLFLAGWLIYLAYECYLIFSYNKLNKLLVDNQDKYQIKDAE